MPNFLKKKVFSEEHEDDLEIIAKIDCPMFQKRQFYSATKAIGWR